jgi:hypothetical protein
MASKTDSGKTGERLSSKKLMHSRRLARRNALLTSRWQGFFKTLRRRRDRDGKVLILGRTSMNTATHEAAIRQRAYAIWEEEGRPDGREWDHWERALREIISSEPLTPQTIESTPKPKARKTPKGRIRSALKSALSS